MSMLRVGTGMCLLATKVRIKLPVGTAVAYSTVEIIKMPSLKAEIISYCSAPDPCIQAECEPCQYIIDDIRAAIADNNVTAEAFPELTIECNKLCHVKTTRPITSYTCDVYQKIILLELILNIG